MTECLPEMLLITNGVQVIEDLRGTRVHGTTEST